MLRETDADRDARELVEWTRGRGGRVTVRELQQGRRKHRNSSEAAEAALNALVHAGAGSWETVPTTAKRGQPTRAFVLATRLQSTQPLRNREKTAGSADVDVVDTGSSDGSDRREREAIRAVEAEAERRVIARLDETRKEERVRC
jgi:RecA-family ATPase